MQFAPAPRQVLPILEHNYKPAPRYRPKADRVVQLRYDSFKSFDNNRTKLLRIRCELITEICKIRFFLFGARILRLGFFQKGKYRF